MREEEERGKIEKGQQDRGKHPKKSLSDKELDEREKGPLRQRKYVANKAQKKIHAATTIEVGHNDGGSGGDGVVKNSPIDNVDTNRCR